MAAAQSTESIGNKNPVSKNKILKTLTSDQDLDLKNLKSIRGIGQGTIDKIKEIIDTNTLQEYEKIKDKKSPYEDFLKIHGVGKKHAKKLYESGFRTIDDLHNCKDIQNHLNDTQLKGLQYYNDILHLLILFQIINIYKNTSLEDLKNIWD